MTILSQRYYSDINGYAIHDRLFLFIYRGKIKKKQ